MKKISEATKLEHYIENFVKLLFSTKYFFIISTTLIYHAIKNFLHKTLDKDLLT